VSKTFFDCEWLSGQDNALEACNNFVKENTKGNIILLQKFKN
jgi:hypothetical protein